MSYRSNQPNQETEIFCTYCMNCPVPATKSCLLCEASLCNDHLRVHSKAAEHVLCDPTNSPGNKKCSIHQKILEYYCTEDSACICVSCRLDGEHQGHRVEMMDEAFKKKKEKLRHVLQSLTTKREETEKSLQKCRRDQKKASDTTERFAALFADIRKELEDLEKRVSSEISRKKECISPSVSALEIKKDELSRKIHHMEELCNLSDPVTVLQEPDTGDLCDTEDRDRHYSEDPDVEDLDVGLISQTIYRRLSDIIKGICVQEPKDILLDANTAGNKLRISRDRKTVSETLRDENCPGTPERFQYNQVLSTGSLSSGRYYWEADVSKSRSWRVGMCYHSIERIGNESLIGENNKSWGLDRIVNHYSVRHDNREIQLPDKIPYTRVRICLDYEAGELSFYSLCDPITLLHTFTTTFTDPLHAALGVWKGHIKICGGVRTWEKQN
ncbi:tripartite motif-containing protein 16-like [Pseudophryne corroboree]|uniref:tripartite motif-containing protein 16-like n=1 Tax=Pseudophryne corroboree TaxID=495146 RepID=UPI0030818E59